MAWLEEDPSSGHFKIWFRWGGTKLKMTSRNCAEAVLARFGENLQLLERGGLEPPLDADIGAFLRSDGQLTGQISAQSYLSERAWPLSGADGVSDAKAGLAIRSGRAIRGMCFWRRSSSAVSAD